MNQPFPLPTSWQAEPYETHYSFAYLSECGQRKDFDFRVEFAEGVGQHEQIAVVDLIEAAPRLLTALNGLLDALGSQRTRILTGDMTDAVKEAFDVAKVATGRAS